MSADAWRSTAEARWAAFFTEIGWSYDYEYGTFGNYLPDFLLSTTGTNGIICEVKGGASSFDDLVGQAHKLWAMRDRLDHPILLALPNRPRKAWRPFNGKRLPFACGAVWSYKAGAPVAVTFCWCSTCGVGLAARGHSTLCVACRHDTAQPLTGDTMMPGSIERLVYDAWQFAMADRDARKMMEKWSIESGHAYRGEGHEKLDDEFAAIVGGMP